MRKVIVFLTILLTIFLIACEPDKYYFKDNERIDEIISIELIEYSADDIKVIESVDMMLDFYDDKMTIIETLDENAIQGFFSRFSDLEFFQGYPHLNTPNGVGIKINYDNGDFLIVTDNLNSEESYGGDAILYNSDGVFLEYYGSLSWIQNFIDLLNEYFQIQTE